MHCRGKKHWSHTHVSIIIFLIFRVLCLEKGMVMIGGKVKTLGFESPPHQGRCSMDLWRERHNLDLLCTGVWLGLVPPLV